MTLSPPHSAPRPQPSSAVGGQSRRRITAATWLLMASALLNACTPSTTTDAFDDLPKRIRGYVGEEIPMKTSAVPHIPYTVALGDGKSLQVATARFALTYDAPGHYQAVAHRPGRSHSFTVAVVYRPLDPPPTQSSTIAWSADGKEIWVVNEDHHTVSILDGVTGELIQEVNVGGQPGTLSINGDAVWVTLPLLDALIHIERATPEIKRGVSFPYGARPFGVAAVPGLPNVGVVSFQGNGEILHLDLNGAPMPSLLATASDLRHVAVHPDGTVWAAQFRSRHNAAKLLHTNYAKAGVDEAGESLALPITEDISDSDTQTRGVPSQLGGLAIRPDGRQLWIPSVQANVLRGGARDGDALTFETTLRAVLDYVNLSEAPTWSSRKQFDDRDMSVATVFTPFGDYAYVAIQGANTVEVMDALSGTHAGTLSNVGLAPQGLAIHPEGTRLAVHGALSRTISFWDLSEGPLPAQPDYVVSTVKNEVLDAQVLAGKIIFHQSADTRMSRSGYTSCASCHADGGDDGLTWDFTDRGEGLRNTISLRGKAGMAHGPLHWSANFDEVQDFENDMRHGFSGTGFLSDDLFFEADREHPIGAPKAGLSVELDALAAYVTSLNDFGRSPYRLPNGKLSAAAERGQDIFLSAETQCAVCHIPPLYTDSSLAADPFILHDVGTLGPHSGGRLGGLLPGIDTPTLRGLFDSAPYLHDGSAASLHEVLVDRNPGDVHGTTSLLSNSQLDDLTAFLLSLDLQD
jgi:DNA-binding beta-propeller fold protein YncE